MIYDFRCQPLYAYTCDKPISVTTPDTYTNCGVLTGSYFPFAATKAERLLSGDPRPSLQETYVNHDGFVNAVRAAARELVRERFLLEADADADVDAAEASNVLQ